MCWFCVSLHLLFIPPLLSVPSFPLFYNPNNKNPHHERGQNPPWQSKAGLGADESTLDVREGVRRARRARHTAQEKREPSHGDGGGDDGRRGARGRRGGGGRSAGGGALGGGVPHRGAPRPRAEGAYLSSPPICLDLFLFLFSAV